ncbi:hypothetical protein DIPPA_29960 [Diplonema papillatum]|nr:hypothetical protein DIPPA_29960 [Diplonema papillatum]
MNFDDDDEAAMDAILRDASMKPAAGEKAPAKQKIPNLTHGSPGKGERQASGWDTDSDDEGTPLGGPIRVVAAGGEQIAFPSFTAAAMSKRVPDGATIHVPAGVHHWPGGDLRHSVVGADAKTTTIEGNDGCGYFFYLRRAGLSISNVTLRGSTRGRAHVYVDELRDIVVKGVRFQGAYNNCVEILGSKNVEVARCLLEDAMQPAVSCQKDCSGVSVVANQFAESCTAPLIAFHNTSSAQAVDNVLRSKTTGVFDVRCLASDVHLDNNTVAFL